MELMDEKTRGQKSRDRVPYVHKTDLLTFILQICVAFWSVYYRKTHIYLYLQVFLRGSYR
jgi:hypothetical protein